MTDYQGEHEGVPAEEPIIGDAPPRAHTLFSNRAYDILTWVARVVLPALALFYISMAPLWGFPKQEEVAGTIVATDLLLGALLGLSSTKYKHSDARFDGVINLVPDSAAGTTDVQVRLDTAAVVNKDSVVVKVNKP